MQTGVTWLLLLFLCFCSTHWDVSAVKMHSAEWIRDEINGLFVQNAHSVLCGGMLGVVQCVTAKHSFCWCLPWTNTWTLVKWAFHTNSYTTNSGFMTSAAGLAVTQWCPPMEPGMSLYRAQPVMLLSHSEGPDRQHSKDDSQAIRAQLETIDRTPGSNDEWSPRLHQKNRRLV